MSVNPVRPCWGCSVFDDHPRHVVVLANGADEPMHVDCCADRRGCQVCAQQIADVAPGTVGQAMREHLLSLPPAQVVHVPNDDDGDPLNITTAVVTPLEG